jgi:hypothetical protein
MPNPGLIKTFTSALAIPAYTIVKFDSSDNAVAAAAAATDKMFGITTDIASSAGGECDVIVDDIAYVIAGGTIVRGDLLTSDASGHAVSIVPGVAAAARVIGVAMVSAASGDVFNCLIAPAAATTT